MRVQQLGDLGTAATVLRAVAAAAQASGRPAPAALTGIWFGSRAVIAPSLLTYPVHPRHVFGSQGAESGSISHSGVVGGGWVGYLSYPDTATADNEPRRIPMAAGGWTDSVLRQDDNGCWWYENLLEERCPDWITTAIENGVAPQHWLVDWEAPSRAHHRETIQRCLAAIAAGEIYQACVCTQFRGTFSGSAVDFYADAITDSDPARAAFISGDWGTIASLSPELFLQRIGINVRSSPIKGTLPASADPAALLSSAKDVAENIMITDLVRNDLGRVALTGSVSVPELLAVHPAPGVWHLVSTVLAAVSTSVTTAELLNATFPPASVTGTPKTRARQLLSGWEQASRGVYCGAIGMMSPAAGLELNVAIRTVEISPSGAAVLGVGGGITADSEPHAEWQECLDKAATTLDLRAQAKSTSHPPRTLSSAI